MKKITNRIKQSFIFPGDERNILIKSLADSCKRNADYEFKIAWFEKLSKNLRQHIVNLNSDNKVSETFIKTLKYEIELLKRQNEEIIQLKETINRKDQYIDCLCEEIDILKKQIKILKTKITKQKNKLEVYHNLQQEYSKDFIIE